MKYGEHLKANISPEYGPEPYLKYYVLHDIIDDLSARAPSSAIMDNRQVSLTAPPQTNAQGLAQSDEMPTEENFLKVLEEEMVKVEAFTLQKVTELRQKLEAAEKLLLLEDSAAKSNNDDEILTLGDEIAEDFLRLEKYVNINFMGFHKILKKHDKHLPNMPCKDFYVNRMHAQAWVRGDYSDLVVRLSHIYATIRKDKKDNNNDDDNNNNNDTTETDNENNENNAGGDNNHYFPPMTHTPSLQASYYGNEYDDYRSGWSTHNKQNFLRSTTKYWIKTEDVSRVKYAILRHLPLILTENAESPKESSPRAGAGESDSRFTNSVYLDNDQLELYHSRLDKTANAIELRLRWYGTNDPRTVFVERKTHNKKWTGEVSFKERFKIEEPDVQKILTNTFPIEEKKQEMLSKGKTPQEVEEWETLIREVEQVISSKQLIPTVRTQCMRTAFQIPFDPSVRISLDTNLCMIDERGYDDQDMKIWHRDPTWVLQPNEIHRFPHAVLEVKLQMPAIGANNDFHITPPKWITDLQNSGWLYECHKYSKYVHGCSVLLPEDVRSVPYWVDDISLRESILASGAKRILSSESSSDQYDQLLPFGGAGATGGESSTLRGDATSTIRSMDTTKGGVHPNNINGGGGETTPLLGGGGGSGDADENAMEAFQEDEDGRIMCCGGWMFQFCSRNNNNYESVVVPQSIQKIEPKVFFANERTFLHWLHYAVILASIASGILAYSERSPEDTWAVYYAMTLLPISLAFCIYALHIFLWRNDRIKTRIPGRWDDPLGPLTLGGIVAVVLTVNFASKLYEIAKFAKYNNSGEF